MHYLSWNENIITEISYLKKLFVVTAFISLSISAIFGISILILGNFGETQQKLLITTVLFGAFSILGITHSISGQKRQLLPIRILGIVSSAGALLILLSALWSLVEIRELSWKIIFTLILLSGMSAHVSLLSMIRRPNWMIKAWYYFAVIVPFLVVAWILGHIWSLMSFDDGTFFRYLGIILILDVLGTVGIFPLSRIYGKLAGK